MDPIPEIDADLVEPTVVRPAVAPQPSEGVVDAPPVGDAIEAGSGALAETESLMGAVMAASPDGEAEALRRTLELDERPPTAVPTLDEQADQADALRRTVAGEPLPGAAQQVDPTEQFEAHDSALSGDPLAQAIDANAAAQRTEQAARADQRDDAATRQEHVPGATDRATQDSGAAAATQFGAGRPATRPADIDREREAGEERIEQVDGIAASQRVRPHSEGDEQ